MLQVIGSSGSLYGIDADSRNLVVAKERLKYPNVHFIHANFETLEEVGNQVLLKEKKIDAILFDLGLSSLHVDEAERGFSFRSEGPLDMRFDTSSDLTAADIINSYPVDSLISIFKTYGEEKFSYRIANEIVRRRRASKFTTTKELADAIAAISYKNSHIHPATRVFQALRIATNREIEVLNSGLVAAVNILSPGGRLAVISYHSLEDRIVKHFMRNEAKEDRLTIITKKPVEPDLEELEENRRSRSAKLRVAEKN